MKSSGTGAWIRERVEERRGEGASLHARYLNPRMNEAAAALGFDRDFRAAEGPWLLAEDGARYLDFISGYGVFFLGRNHPEIDAAIREIMNMRLPNLVQVEGSLLAGLLAESLLSRTKAPVERVFFANSGAEGIEAAIKFARAATGRPRLLYLENGFHGLTAGALSLQSGPFHKQGFGPPLPGATAIALNDTLSLEAELAGRDVAALVLEPIQGYGVTSPHPEFLAAAQELCRRYETLLVADEVMTGLGRTGRWFGFEHAGFEPDMIVTSKALSGGYVPVSAVLMRGWIHDRVYSSAARAGVHFSTFGANDLAMAAGLATIEVITREGLVERAERLGERFRTRLGEVAQRHPMIKGVRGQGLMLGIEFQAPEGFWQKMDWDIAHRLNGSLFCIKVVMDLARDHRILTLSAGRGVDVLRLLPPAVMGEDEIDYFCNALDQVLTKLARFPGVLLDLGATLLERAATRK